METCWIWPSDWACISWFVGLKGSGSFPGNPSLASPTLPGRHWQEFIMEFINLHLQQLKSANLYFPLIIYSLSSPGWKRSRGLFAPCMRNIIICFFLMIGICINSQYHKGQGEKEQPQSWVFIILLLTSAVEPMLIVFNLRFKDRFQAYQEWGNSLSLSPVLGFSCSDHQSLDFLISCFIHFGLEDSVQRKEDFMQVKRKSKLLWLWELPGIPSPGDREEKKQERKIQGRESTWRFSHPSLLGSTSHSRTGKAQKARKWWGQN